VDLADGVVNWPQDEDRGVVTQCVEIAFVNNLLYYTVSDIPVMSGYLGFSGPAASETSQCKSFPICRL
jgi:hypothetical protein